MMQTRVLLVIDNPEVGSIWAHALRHMGLEAVRAASSDEALDFWAEEVFDMTLIDVYGPELDGIDLFRRLRVEAVNPILLFTPAIEETHVL